MAEPGISLRGKQGLRGYAHISPDVFGVNEFTFVRLDNGAEYYVPSELFRPHPDGGYEVDLDADDLQQFEAARRPSLAPPDSRESLSFSHTETVPVVAEEVTLGRKTHHTTIRLDKSISRREVTLDEPLIREEVEVTRVPVNRVIAEPVPPRQEGDTFIVPIYEEVLVTEKQLVLREEVHIVRRRVEGRDPQSVTLRTEHLHVHRVEEKHPDTQEPGKTGDQ